MMKLSAQLFQIQIVVHGRAIQEYRDQRGATFVEGRAGSTFELQLTNLTPRRLLVHPTVDGLSVMNGKEAARNDSSMGYVLHPNSTSTIPGWRLDSETVAQFYFAGSGESYAEKKGVGENKGVIACAVWEEQPEYDADGLFEKAIRKAQRRGIVFDPYKKEWPTKSPFRFSATKSVRGGEEATKGPFGFMNSVASAAAPSVEERTSGTLGFSEVQARGLLPMNNLGTGFGVSASHHVTSVSFTPASVEPVAIAVIYYDDLEGLKARGIKIRQEKTKQDLPNPFPKSKGPGCEPPAGWRG